MINKREAWSVRGKRYEVGLHWMMNLYDWLLFEDAHVNIIGWYWIYFKQISPRQQQFACRAGSGIDPSGGR